MIARNSPRLPVYSGGPVIGGRPVPIASGDLPDDFAERLIRLKKASGLTWGEFAEALGVELKQVLRWQKGTEPCGGAYHALVGLAPWIPGGLGILMGENFLDPVGKE
ncbi:MAG: helix-turn-helix domain-containing protein [Chloroflexota bacterium]|nr:helix-turn-helix domain-containing protein [Chloroflexota bacterium]